MTTCRRWTTATCAAAGRPCTRDRRRHRDPRRRRAADARLRHHHPRRDPQRRRRSPAADPRAGARLGHRRHGRRPDARPRRRRPLRRPRAGRRGAAAADEDRRAAALRLHRRRDPRPVLARRNIRRSTITAARSAKPSRSPTTCSTSKATRRRSASRPAQDAALGKTTFVTQLGDRRRQAARARPAGARRCRAVDLRRQGRRAARRRALRRRTQELKRIDGRQERSEDPVLAPLPEDVRAGARGLCAAAHLHFDRDRHRGVLPAAGLAAAGDAAADRLGHLRRALSACWSSP